MMLLAPQLFTSSGGHVTNGLQLHLDAGQSGSYSSGQSWLDLTSNGFDFFLGETGTASTDDPTFNGVAGGKSSSEYFSLDGGDHFQMDANDLGSIMREIGRSGQGFTIEAWYYHKTTSGVEYLMSTSDGGAADDGFGLEVGRTADKMTLILQPANSVTAANTTALTNNTWHQIGIQGTSDAVAGNFILNGATDGSWTLNNSGWTAGDSTNKMRISSSGRAVGSQLLNGTRIAIIRIYDRVLSASELSKNFNANKDRFGL